MAQLQVWFCRPMIFFPYVLRALRLRQIWVVHQSQMCEEHGQASSKEPRTFFIQEKNLIYCLYVVLVPLAILCFISAVVPELTLLLPYFNISQCAHSPNYTTYYQDINNAMLSFTISQTFRNLILFGSVFLLREIDDTFNITKELRWVIVISTVCFTAYTLTILFFGHSLFVILGFCQYFWVITCISLLYLTAIEPLLRTYHPSSIIPFSLNKECIANVESAMIQEISSRYFYNFLYKDLKEERGIVLFALYADLRRFMVLCDDKETSKQELVELASQIYQDFILPGSDFELDKNQLVTHLRQGFDAKRGMIILEVNETLFQGLILFAAGGLEVYYDLFMQSERFQDLQIEVEK